MGNTIAVAAVFEARQMRQGIEQINGQLGGFQRSATKAGKVLKTAFITTAAVAGLSSLTSAVGGVIEEAREAQKVTAQVEQVIKSTGGVANVTAKQVDSLSSSISAKSGIDDEAIATGAAMLLTFKAVRNETGRGRDIFNQATKAAVDLAAAGFGSITSQSKTLGKALNDPIKGMTALAKSGVTFTKEQAARIKQYVAEGKSLKAQQIILKEVNSQVGGQAAAQATAGERLRVTVDNIKEQIGTALLPTLDKAGTYLADKLPGWMDTATAAFADTRDAIEQARQSIDDVRAAIDSVPGPVKQLILVFGAAVIAKRLLTSAIGTTSDAYNNRLKPALANTVAAATQANTKLIAAKGAALLAGGALLTMANNGSTSSQSLRDVMNVAGSVAAGFAVGGPFGAAIGGASALYGVLGRESEDSARRQQAFLDMQAQINSQAKTLTSTLNEQTGAITGLTRETIAKNLADNGAFTAADKIGVSYDVVTKAALGNADAQRTVAAAVGEYQAAAVKGKKGSDDFIEALAGAKEVTGPLTTAVNTFSTELDRTKNATAQAQVAIDKMAESAGKASPLMAAAGAQAGAGFYNGLKGWLGSIEQVGGQIGTVVAQAARDKLDVRSPSRVMYAIGGYVAEGLANGMIDGNGSVRSATVDLAKTINETLPKSIKKSSAIKKWYAEHAKDVRAGTREVIAALRASANEQLAQIKAQSAQYAAAVTDSARTYAGLGNLQHGENESLSGDGIVQYLTDRLNSVDNFNDKLASIRGTVTEDTYNQIVQMGVQQGTAYAEALSTASPQTLAQITTLQTQINASTTTLGAATAATMYAAGIASAQGFRDGLESQLQGIEKAGLKISKQLVKALKKALGIKSPSRVMKVLGTQTVDGLQIGLDERRMARSGTRLAAALQDGFKSPQLDAQLAAGMAQMGTKTTGDNYVINVQLDSSMTQEQMGVGYNNAIEAAKRIGLVR